MPASIAEYLLHLARFQAAHDLHEQDPEGTMRAFGLTDEQIPIVASRDPQRIRDAVQGELQTAIPSGDEPYYPVMTIAACVRCGGGGGAAVPPAPPGGPQV